MSVVIPTIGRPVLRRAVESALSQESAPFEILVVADTLAPIDLPVNPKVKLIRVGPGAGGNVARQAGIQAAEGELVALLDDDDEWLGNHLANQLRLIPSEEGGHYWIASSRLFARDAKGKSRVWPKRLMNASETLPQYIFRKTALVGGVGFIQASTLMFPRRLGLEVPFDADLKFHQDVSWLVDLSKIDHDVAVFQSPEPSVVYHIGSATVSKKITASQSIAWASRLDPEDRRTIGDFVVVHSIQGAKNSGSLTAMLKTVIAGLRIGKPSGWAVAYAAALVVRMALAKFGTRNR
ncbi:glycosyltransferase family 2 protein [Pseudarthrobacter sp. S3]|uniref:glycosyltransferase family 2 protein n=1 Tax=Pseudarthrobacter sp. S3 TaxID=3418419 RepID=UPI003CF4CBCB